MHFAHKGDGVLSMDTKQICVYYFDELRVSKGSNCDLQMFAVARMGNNQTSAQDAVPHVKQMGQSLMKQA
jgi:hypothetical protein